ncbi:sodium/calcium exchanger membrane protein [Thalassobacillus devorans]|uniref:Sodium/calcium exchanger membrane protein n=1 Tax=Thalassobacillus devorans TaxID=279813 RepID=A0ABQ1PR43_9BACI|nr:sodium:calcium antiporter [Thalassobacillus devorans]NIK30595.1 cation:H+ antiporter [Thalassobacillus devorans]GGD01673.1 sodium/calcium exchanger membrane protein [Thalassobacillus devorans]
MIYVIFIIAAVATIYLSVKISNYVDVIDKKSTLKAAFLGVLLGGATSLPEVTTSVTSVIIDNPDIAVGNVMGSNMFNLLILAVMDAIFRRKRIFNHATNENFYTMGLFMLLSLTVVVSILIPIPFSFFGIGWESIAMVVMYVIGAKIISKAGDGQEESESEGQVEVYGAYKHVTLKRAVIGFIISAILVLAAGSALTISADKIAVITGLGSSFVGTFLVAASTSLPEAVSVFVALKLRNYPLAIGSILGSNLFNLMILVGTDVLYWQEAILQTVSNTHAITTLSAMALGLLAIYPIIRVQVKNKLTYVLPSLLMVITYFISSYLIYVNS